MKVIVCLDDNDGMLFNKRRQSKDKTLRRYLLDQLGDHKLFMNEYSKKQFEEDDARIMVADNYLDLASEEDFCFVETDAVAPYEERISSIIIVHWNRKYPTDMSFDINYHEAPWELIQTTELVGNSHPEIVIEEYKKGTVAE